ATHEELQTKRCRPCEGGVEPLKPLEIAQLLQALPQWSLSEDGKHIMRKWKMKDFKSSMQFLNRVAEIAESENHHPDLHLTGYREVAIELSTHAVGGLSENDFVLAAKIDQIAV